MQKKFLLLFMVACCGVIGAKDSHAGNKTHTQTVPQIVRDVREGDMSEPMGALEFMVKNLDEQQIEEYIKDKNRKLAIAERLLREENIAQYRKSNKEGFEKALGDELSGTADAIKKEFDTNVAANQEEATRNKAKKWDGSLGWSATAPTKASEYVRDSAAIDAVLEKKNRINQTNKDLVTENKNYVSRVVHRELSSVNQALRTQYVRGLQVCGDDAVCLGKRGINWQDVTAEGFFDNFTLAAYQKAVIASQQIGIALNAEDMKKMAEKNAMIAPVAKQVDIAIMQAKEERNKILNPTVKDGESEKPSILDNDKKQEDQGALS